MMIQHAVSVLLFALTAAFAVAQEPPPQQNQPPALDSSSWEIRDGNGNAIGYHVEWHLLTIDPMGNKHYVGRVIKTATGEYTGVHAFATSMMGGRVNAVWSSDSGQWCQWKWDGDHYDKVGGSNHVRSYHKMT